MSNIVNLLVEHDPPYADSCVVDKWKPDLFHIRTKNCYPGVGHIYTAKALLGIGLKPKFHLLPENKSVDIMCQDNNTKYDMLANMLVREWVQDNCDYVPLNVYDDLLFIYKTESITDSDILFSICSWQVWMVLALITGCAYCTQFTNCLKKVHPFLWTLNLLLTVIILGTYSNFLALALFKEPIKISKTLDNLVDLIGSGKCAGVFLIKNDPAYWFLKGDYTYPIFKDYPEWADKLKRIQSEHILDFYDFINKIRDPKKCYIGVDYTGEIPLFQAIADCYNHKDISFLTDERLPKITYGFQVRRNFSLLSPILKSLRVVDSDEAYIQLDEEFVRKFKEDCYARTVREGVDHEAPTITSLNLTQIDDVFILLIMILLLASFILSIELYVSHRTK